MFCQRSMTTIVATAVPATRPTYSILRRRSAGGVCGLGLPASAIVILLSRRAVPDLRVAADAIQPRRFGIGQMGDGAQEVPVTAKAVVSNDPGVAGADLDRLMEILKRKPFRVPVPVLG